MKIGLSSAECFFCTGVEAEESDELDEGGDEAEENSVEMEWMLEEPLAPPISAGPKQLNTTGK